MLESWFTCFIAVDMVVTSPVASFIVPVAVDVVVDDVPDSDELNGVGVGDGELDNGSLSLTCWVMVKLIEFNRRSPRNSVLGAMAQHIDAMVLLHHAFWFISCSSFYGPALPSAPSLSVQAPVLAPVLSKSFLRPLLPL